LRDTKERLGRRDTGEQGLKNGLDTNVRPAASGPTVSTSGRFLCGKGGNDDANWWERGSRERKVILSKHVVGGGAINMLKSVKSPESTEHKLHKQRLSTKPCRGFSQGTPGRGDDFAWENVHILVFKLFFREPGSLSKQKKWDLARR